MDKIRKETRDLRMLEKEQKEVEEELAAVKKDIDEVKTEIAQGYQDFFTKKRNREFVYYKRYPSFESLGLYTKRISKEHPLQSYGNFNVKELAEIIKHLYQFSRGQEYKILTMGTTEQCGTPVYQGQSWSLIPHLYFVIGNDKSLDQYQEYNGLYFNEEKNFDFTYCFRRGKQDLVAIGLEIAVFSLNKDIDIACYMDNSFDEEGMINYGNYEDGGYSFEKFNSQKNIYQRNLRLPLSSYKSINDIMGFNVHINDAFLSRILISISIYKHNNGINELTDEDYNHIFGVLFNEKVNIKASSSVDIPQTLKYIPHPKYNK